jgi:hypothetical protein
MLLRVSLITFLGSTLLCASGLNIGNSDFETSDLSVGVFGGCSGGFSGVTYLYNATGCGQVWNFQGGSGLTRDPSAFNNPGGPDGSPQSAFLQDISDFSQTVTGIDVGSTYTLSFFAIQRTCCDGSFAQTVSLEFDGTPLTFSSGASTSVLPTTAGWTLYTTDSFVAQNATAVLRFIGNYGGADATAFVDQISSTETSAAPEPGTWGLLATGLGGLIWSLRRKK